MPRESARRSQYKWASSMSPKMRLGPCRSYFYFKSTLFLAKASWSRAGASPTARCTLHSSAHSSSHRVVARSSTVPYRLAVA